MTGGEHSQFLNIPNQILYLSHILKGCLALVANKLQIVYQTERQAEIIPMERSFELRVLSYESGFGYEL